MKSKRRLQLKGTDDAYARKDAARAAKQEEPKVEGTDTSSVSKNPEPRPASQVSTKPRKPVAQSPARKTAVARPDTAEVRVNYRLNLGEELSHKLERVAVQYDQPMELIMKAARNRAVTRFRAFALADSAPEMPVPNSGGQFTRLSTVFSGEIADNLNRWFDPLKLDVAKDRIKPILLDLFQQEAQAICDSAE